MVGGLEEWWMEEVVVGYQQLITFSKSCRWNSEDDTSVLLRMNE
jgi:hypothetical protein